MTDSIRLDRLTKKLNIYQDPSGFCFGTDAVLLAWFCRRKKAERPVDLCAGNGVIPLLLSEGNYKEIYGVELLPRQAELAEMSAEHNGLSERVKIICGDLRQIGKTEERKFAALTRGGFDLVTVNPPYAPSGRGKQAEGTRGVARSEKECTLQEVIEAAAFLLKHGGRLCMVNRAERLADIFSAMRKVRIEPKVLLPVIPKPGKGVALVLVEGKKGAESDLTVEEPLYIHNADGSEPELIREIYKDFRQ